MQLALGRCETHSNPIVLLFSNDICKNIKLDVFKQKCLNAAIKRLRCQKFQQYFLIDEVNVQKIVIMNIFMNHHTQNEDKE